MNRALKDAMVKRCQYEHYGLSNTHLQAFLRVYNHAKLFKKLRDNTSHEFMVVEYTKNTWYIYTIPNP